MVNMKSFALLVLLIALPYMMGVATAVQCGWQVGRRCPGSLCCSVHGYCGTTWDYCSRGQCQLGYGICWRSWATLNSGSPQAQAQAQAQAHEAQEVMCIV
ncbi:hypothetical protein RND81_11G195700 [Saponaria officinalis]|uniref:Chitin-binding type-1 domain-containing protein n=1 Tax=Saponaria officinalis TaxID=3572 RepID=A0AAW1HP79_SAPOF